MYIMISSSNEKISKRLYKTRILLLELGYCNAYISLYSLTTSSFYALLFRQLLRKCVCWTKLCLGWWVIVFIPFTLDFLLAARTAAALHCLHFRTATLISHLIQIFLICSCFLIEGRIFLNTIRSRTPQARHWIIVGTIISLFLLLNFDLNQRCLLGDLTKHKYKNKYKNVSDFNAKKR